MKYLTSFLAQSSYSGFTPQGTDKADKSPSCPTFTEAAKARDTDKTDRSQPVTADPSMAALPGIDTPTATMSGTTTRPLATIGWGYDWKGTLVDLRGLRPGEDGRPPIFISAKPEGLQ